LNPSNGKIIADEGEKSSLDHVYAIGDMLDGKPELTPVAIQVKKKLGDFIHLWRKTFCLTPGW